MMKLDNLRYFCAVVEEGSFRGAAGRLHVSQPAVSQQIKALERDLRRTLLERRGCRPTPVGQRLYDRARHILNETESLTRELDDFDEAEARELRVGTSDTTALYLLPPVVREFSRSMPQTRLVLINRPSDAIAAQVRRGELDLGIVTLPVAAEDLVQRDLFKQQLVLVTPRRHRLATRTRVSLSDLEGEPLLLLDASTRTGSLLGEYFDRKGFKPQVVLDSGSFEVIKRYVAQGVGSAFLPRVTVSNRDAGLATVEVGGLPSVRIGAIWRRHAYRTRAESTFMDMIAADLSGRV
jgi:DNA-binding transcriptional LysR family regulator